MGTSPSDEPETLRVEPVAGPYVLEFRKNRWYTVTDSRDGSAREYFPADDKGVGEGKARDMVERLNRELQETNE